MFSGIRVGRVDTWAAKEINFNKHEQFVENAHMVFVQAVQSSAQIIC